MTTNEKLDLLQKANEYNFDEIANLFFLQNNKKVAKSLLLIYFEFSGCMMREGNECCLLPEIEDAMYDLRIVYNAIEAMSESNDATIKFTIR